MLAIASGTSAFAETKIRVGHFPNVTHVQALVAHALSRQGKGWFEEKIGPGTKIEWFVYNAGPSAMEAIFANSIDLTYVGPSPAINAYSKSHGEEIRIVSGAANGGAALVVQSDSALKSAADFRGKKIATPQLGNTQDVSCRAWLAAGGLKITQLGGDAQVLPTQNPDQISLFRQKQIDAVWTVEPWVSRLEMEAGGKILVDETDAITTVLVSSAKFSSAERELAKKFVEAHRALTDWIEKNPAEAQKLVVAELSEETKAKISDELVARAWKRIVLTNEVRREPLAKFVENAKTAGFLRDVPDLSRLIETF
ncbi:MAG: sulfonate transport system substrate-binding protein [Verrucomicrobiota bacterium]